MLYCEGHTRELEPFYVCVKRQLSEEAVPTPFYRFEPEKWAVKLLLFLSKALKAEQAVHDLFTNGRRRSASACGLEDVGRRS